MMPRCGSLAVRLVACAAIAVAIVLSAGAARAHMVRPGVLALKELSPGLFAMHWSPPSDGTTALAGASPKFPAQCREEGESLVDCGERGLTGAIRFEDGAAYSGVSVDIAWLGGRRELRVASGDPAVVFVSGTPSRASFAQRAEIARSYVAMGVRHILLGVDHLMFVAGLLLFVGSMRRLLATITSFTLAHSVTLALSALGWVRPPSAPVELCIALSILLLAVEATRRRRTWTHRAPWIVAFLFGLLHGFGFASALTEAGLPPQHLPLALASFNFGVEAGQIATVVLLAGAHRLVRALGERAAQRAHVVAVSALGVASAYWCFERALAVWTTVH